MLGIESGLKQSFTEPPSVAVELAFTFVGTVDDDDRRRVTCASWDRAVKTVSVR